MQRVLVIGNSGAGKSTAAVRLGAAVSLPVHHLDQLFWQPGWRQSPRDQFDDRLAQVLAGDAWVIDGNFSRTLPQRLEAADTVVWLDFSTVTCMRGVLTRWVRFRGRQRPDMGANCPEKVDWPFLWYVCRWRARHAQPLAQRLAADRSCGVDVHRFRRRTEVETWLRQLSAADGADGARYGA